MKNVSLTLTFCLMNFLGIAQITPSIRLEGFNKVNPPEETENEQLQETIDMIKSDTGKKPEEKNAAIKAAKKTAKENDNSRYGFRTPGLSEWNRRNRENNGKYEEIEKIQDELDQDAAGEGTRLTLNEIITKRDDIKNLKQDIAKNEKIMDSVWQEHVNDFMVYDRNILGFDPYRSLALYNTIKGDDSGNPFRFVNSASITLGPNTSSISSEIFTGCWSIFHASFGSILTASSSENTEKAKEEEAYQRLAQNGGNVYLRLDYPIWYIHTYGERLRITLLTRMNFKGAADIPNFGTRSDSFAASASYGGDVYLNFGAPIKGAKLKQDKDRSLNFFVYLNIARYKGTDVYKDNLGIETTAFNYGQLGAGIVVNNTFKISFIFNNFSSVPALRNSRPTGGGEFLNN